MTATQLIAHRRARSLTSSIVLAMPSHDRALKTFVEELLAPFGEVRPERINLRTSDVRYLPKIAIEWTFADSGAAHFKTEETAVSLHLRNETGTEQASAHEYEHLAVSDVRQRMAGLTPSLLDHVGVNLPWFEGIHPRVTELRNVLAGGCAYHLSPTGEPWDFIIPATAEEITSGQQLENAVRRPKFEIVSFDACSTPLVQFDVGLRTDYEEIRTRFPEGIRDDNLRNVWVYLRADLDCDICLVLGVDDGTDWGGLLAGHRLRAAMLETSTD